MTKAGAGALEPPSGPDNADRALESRAVADALRSLLPEHRGVLLETYYHGRSVSEAAAVLGTTAGTVKFRTLSALRALNLALQARGLAPCLPSSALCPRLPEPPRWTWRG